MELDVLAPVFYPSTWGAQMDLLEFKASLITLSSFRPRPCALVTGFFFFAMRETA